MGRKSVDIIFLCAYNIVNNQLPLIMNDMKGREYATFFNGRADKMEK